MSIKGRGHPSKAIIHISSLGDQQVAAGDVIALIDDAGSIDAAIGDTPDTGAFVDVVVEVSRIDGDTGVFVDAVTDRELAQHETAGGATEVTFIVAAGTASDTAASVEAQDSLDNIVQDVDVASGDDVDVSLGVFSVDAGVGADAHTHRQFVQGDQSGVSVEVGVVASTAPISADAGQFAETANAISRGAPAHRTYLVPAEVRVEIVPAS